MNQKQNKIDSILKSIDGIHRAEPRPFFFGRLLAAMGNKTLVWERLIAVITRPAIAYAAILLIIFMNAFAIIETRTGPERNAKQNEWATIDEYSQMNTAFFEGEKLNP